MCIIAYNIHLTNVKIWLYATKSEKCLLSPFVRCCYDAILTRITSQPSLIADGLFKAIPDTEFSLPVLLRISPFSNNLLASPSLTSY